MRDPLEGLDPAGHIVTGVARERVDPAFEPLLQELVERVAPTTSLYLYGSVATGQAVARRSDLDVVALGLEPSRAQDLGRDLTRRWSHLVREVGVGAWSTQDLQAGDAGHGNRVFLRHYCVWLSGPDPAADLPSYPGDQQAARGFNGDLPDRVVRWRSLAHGSTDAARLARLARGMGRKTLFATAGLVSVHDHAWTTDRQTASQRWAELHPDLADDLALLLRWGDAEEAPTVDEVNRLLDGTLATIARQFTDTIGVWDDLH